MFPLCSPSSSCLSISEEEVVDLPTEPLSNSSPQQNFVQQDYESPAKPSEV